MLSMGCEMCEGVCLQLQGNGCGELGEAQVFLLLLFEAALTLVLISTLSLMKTAISGVQLRTQS